MRVTKKIVSLIVLLFLLSSCATLTMGDPAKTALYSAKQSWTEIRTYVLTHNLKGEITDEQLADFKVMDAEFTLYYDLALQIYLTGNSASSPDFETALNTVRNLLLEARQKYIK